MSSWRSASVSKLWCSNFGASYHIIEFTQSTVHLLPLGSQRNNELKDYCRQYTKGGLHDESMPDDPLVLFEQWQQDANAGLPILRGGGDCSTDGSIRQRFVLLKGVMRVDLFSPIITATKLWHRSKPPVVDALSE